MKELLVLFGLILSFNINPYYIKGCGFEGYIFHETHLVMVSIPNQSNRYTPTPDDIKLFESLLKKELRTINKPRVNQVGRCPIIDRKLSKYTRQYVGFMNNDGEKVLWVNFVWDENLERELGDDIVSVLDGCSYYWNIKMNISSRKFFDLHVNGLS